MDPEQVKAAIAAIENKDDAAALEILKALLVSAAGGSASVAPPADGDPSAQGADSAPAVAAALSALRKLTARASLGEVVAELTAWKAARDATASEAQALEQTSRVELTAELVKLGYELPATAWEGDPKDRKPAKHLAALSIADLRTRVVSLRAAPRTPQGHVPPTRGAEGGDAPNGGKIVTLADGRKVTVSAAELQTCTSRKISPEDFATRKAGAVTRI